MIEPLEARIAPALTVINPLADLIVSPGQTGADIDLSRLFDPSITDSGHTIVTLRTNFDSDPATAGIQASAPIVIELFDDAAPLTVQNFLSYLTSSDPKSNYKDTFFHRLSTGFVVQGGGFNVATPGTHIPTPFDVHNEFDGVSRSNLRGTIATAKTGLGPNTGNSEWFFNLANNASNLDAKNGGFTVFAKVIQGMEVVDAIAALKTFNFSGATDNGEASIGTIGSAFNDLPLQNYSANPDGNPNTPPPTPTADNYVKLTGYTITPAPSGMTGGVIYSINPAIDIVDATTGAVSNFVTGTVTGSSLHLNYKAHDAGTVRVTVHGTDAASSTATDTFVVNLQPNLVASFEQDPFDVLVIGGDKKKSNIVIGNNGGGWAVGSVDVKVWLSKIGGTDTNGILVEPDRDFLMGSFLNQPIDLASGGTITLAKSLKIPQQLAIGSETYRVLVQVAPANAGIAERFTDDNVSLDSKVHLWENRFGTITVNGTVERTNAKLVYQEADGDVVKLSIAGKGSGLITFDGTFADLNLTGSKSSSVLKGKLIANGQDGGGDIDLHNLELVQYIGSVKLPNASLTGFLSASQGFHDLTLGNLTGDGLISIGKLPANITGHPSLTFHKVTDFSIESLTRIKSLSAAKWLDKDGVRNRIQAPGIGSIAILGNLEANIALKSPDSLGSLHVGGFFRNASLKAFGNIGDVSVGGLDHAEIFAGVSARPASAGDFAQVASIASLSVSGVGSAPQSFIASNVAAASIGPVFVVGIGGADHLGKFGIVADSVVSYNRENIVTSGPLEAPQIFDKRGRYSLTIV